MLIYQSTREQLYTIYIYTDMVASYSSNHTEDGLKPVVWS